MRHYSRQSQLLQQEVVKVAVKVEELSTSDRFSPDRFSPECLLGLGLVTIALSIALQNL